jgi:hypothetical protein
VLPIPHIGVPTRLELRRQDALAAANPIVLAEASCAHRLRALERLFPGTRVIEIFPGAGEYYKELRGLTEKAMLVVDSNGRVPGLDLVCALGGVSFLGKSPLWPPVATRTLLGQARLLLTDYPLSEQRAALARIRAGDACPGEYTSDADSPDAGPTSRTATTIPARRHAARRWRPHRICC